MIEFQSKEQQTIPSAMIKIIGLGGAGMNILDRVAIDGIQGAELLSLHADVRELSKTIVPERIQLGRQLVKGNGAGGDPELGMQAMLEAESDVRASLRGRKIVFLCVGLGGGTGSGGAPLLARVAREEGAFVVVFATMPFSFEGRRRREQADTALNELAVLSNALVVFDNNRMGELVLAKQGIQDAFAAADHMIAESIKAVIRLVIRPGLIRIGLDELMSALRTNRSRCLFGSGLAHGKDRASKALANALASPLLDSGALLKQAMSVLVHVCGGEDLTLFEVDMLMQKLMRHVPDKAHVLFGVAIDSSMKDGLSITLISALPEEVLQRSVDPEEEERKKLNEILYLEPSEGFATEGTPSNDAVTAAVADSMATDLAPGLVDAVLAPTESFSASSPAPLPAVEMNAASVPSAREQRAAVKQAAPELALALGFEDSTTQVSFSEPSSTVVVPQEDEVAMTAVDESFSDEPRSPALHAGDDVPQNPAPVEPQVALDDEWPDEFDPPPIFQSTPIEPQSSFQEMATHVEEPEVEAYEPYHSGSQDALSQLAEQTRARLVRDGVLPGLAPQGRSETVEQSLFEGDDLDIPSFLRSRRREGI